MRKGDLWTMKSIKNTSKKAKDDNALKRYCEPMEEQKLWLLFRQVQLPLLFLVFQALHLQLFGLGYFYI